MMEALTEEKDIRTTEQERRLHILTVNINGLKTNGEKLLKELEKCEVDVVLLTETHVKDRDAWEKCKEDWKIFFTHYDSSSRGAAILVKRKRDFRYLDVIVNESGHYVILSCWISGIFCTFVSVYHHPNGSGILKELSEKIQPLYTDILLVGGDFNTALDKEKDRTSTSYSGNHNRIRKELKLFMKEHDLKDAWRERHPDDREYTFDYTDKGDPFHSRLDYFFINADKLKLVQDCRINKDKISDHRSVSLILDMKDQTRELQIFSSTVFDLPGDEDLTELCPDIILLTRGQTEHKDYIENMKKEEERKEKKWIVLWSHDSDAAILVTKRQRDIHIIFTAYHEDYVILHCIVFGKLHTFVSVYHPKGSHKNLQDMLQEIRPSYSGTKVIGGKFSTTKQVNKNLMEEYGLENPAGELPYLIDARLKINQDYEIKKQEMLVLSLNFPKMNLQDVDNIIRSLGQIKIHRCLSAATKNNINEENFLLCGKNNCLEY